jgi:phosphate-selective porin OprO/OprP
VQFQFALSLGGENMRSLTTILVVAFSFSALPRLTYAQSTGTADGKQATATSATREEVEQLRAEVAAQRQTIDGLKATVEQLVQAQRAAGSARAEAANIGAQGSPHLVNATLVQPEPSVEAAMATQADKPSDKKPPEKKSEAPVVAGWSGEHFFIKSSDGKFQIQPYGYFQSDYRAYSGDGAPSDTFLIRRARFGFQGNFGKYYDYAVLLDAAASNGLSLRDLYVNIKPAPAFQFQAGQYKEPFSQEELTGASNLDFVERSLASLLYPAAATAYRSPGATLHGDIAGGVVQYWASAFNGKGILTANTTNEPEVIGRLRFYPWKKKKDHIVQGLAFGGAIGHGRSRGLSNENSFGAAMPDAAYTFFPSFRTNGPIERYNGEATWAHGPWALRAEYDQLNQFRRAVGSETSDNLGFVSLPGIVAKAGYGSITYLLTGEARPENGTPKVKHPFLGPEEKGKRGWGAWELGFRYSSIQAHELGINLLNNPITPGFVPTFINHTDQFTFGVNWYLNYLVKYQVNLDWDRLKEPSVQGQVPQNFFVLLQRLQFRF